MGPSQSREQRRLRRPRPPGLESQPQPQSQSQEPTAPEQPEPEPSPTDPQIAMSSSSSFQYSHTPHPPLRTPSFRRRGGHHLQPLSIPPLSSSSSSPPNINAPGIDTPTLTTALSYISARLLAKTKVHHTFIVTGSILFSLFFRSKSVTKSVSLLQTSGLSAKEKEVLISAVIRAAEKFGIEREDWVNNRAEREVRMLEFEDPVRGGDDLVARSLAQGVVVFSGDGMTLYAVDFVYELRRGLWLLSKALENDNNHNNNNAGEEGGGLGDEVDIEDLVELVRRLVAVEGKGRGLRRGIVEGRYERLVFSDYAWLVLGREYERRFGEKGLKEDYEESDDEEGEIVMGSGRGDGESVWTDVS